MQKNTNKSFTTLTGDNSTFIVEENVYDSIFKQYERVVVESLITSFGLDFLLQDQHGGDVDTVHNVRKIGSDKKMVYKNASNQADYESRGIYDYGSFHSNSKFTSKKHEERERWQETGKNIPNEYRPDSNVGFYGHTKSIPNEIKAELDHIVECKAIHDDRGRVLSGLNGIELANMEDNLAWTDKSLNASMGAWARGQNEKYRKGHGCDAPMEMVDIKAYVEAHPELDESTKKNLLLHYEKARKNYDKRIETAYYTSRKFFSDTTKVALRNGALMGIRQALGLVFSEIWFAVKETIVVKDTNPKNIFLHIGESINIGLQRAKDRYKELWNKFIEGAVAGVLSSLTTTLCNIFFTTAKNVVRILQQSWASLVEACKILLFNPDRLPFGERIRAATKIIATGASVVAGSLVGDLIAKTGIGAIPVVGEIVQIFCGTLITGILSCSLLYLLDRDSRIEKIVKVLNSIPTVDDMVNYYRQEASWLEQYSALLMDIDISKFKKEIDGYYSVLDRIDNPMNQATLNSYLKEAVAILEIPCPYKDYSSFGEYMEDAESKPLRFKRR